MPETKRFEEKWIQFRDLVLHADATSVQTAEVRKAFYAGGISFSACMSDLTTAGEEPTPKEVLAMTALHKEMNAFGSAVKAEAAAIRNKRSMPDVDRYAGMSNEARERVKSLIEGPEQAGIPDELQAYLTYLAREAADISPKRRRGILGVTFRSAAMMLDVSTVEECEVLQELQQDIMVTLRDMAGDPKLEYGPYAFQCFIKLMERAGSYAEALGSKKDVPG